jgi:hypothetical protein
MQYRPKPKEFQARKSKNRHPWKNPFSARRMADADSIGPPVDFACLA